LVEAMRLLSGIVGIEFVHFTEVDVVRHPLVAAIIRAYDAREPNRRSPAAAIASALAPSETGGITSPSEIEPKSPVEP
jgi:phosphate starvation-inducible PhoH-like protein